METQKTLTVLAIELDGLEKNCGILSKAANDKPRIVLKIVSEDDIIFDEHQDKLAHIVIGLLKEMMDTKRKEITNLMYPNISV